jgi:hypothetical protein
MVPKNAIQQSPEQIKERKKQVAVRLLKKVLVNKCREHFKQIRGTYCNHKQQKKMRATMQLFKVVSMLQEKMKHNKMFAVLKIKEALQI